MVTSPPIRSRHVPTHSPSQHRRGHHDRGADFLHATATVAEATSFLTEKAFGAAVVIDDAGHPLGW